MPRGSESCRKKRTKSWPTPAWAGRHSTGRRTQDKNLPSWIPSTVHYARWGWGTLEPEKGKIDYDFLDGVLKETRESGQQLAFRVMCCSTYPRRRTILSGCGTSAERSS